MQSGKFAATSGNAFDDVTEALDTVRSHLDMDVSYLSEFRDDEIVFRAVSTVKGLELVSPGDSMPVDHAYCRRVLNGELPNLIKDTRDFPLTETIPATTQIPIRAHISVPIHRTNGDVYGMFCCLSRKPNDTLNERDLNIVTIFAHLAARSLNLQLDKDQALAALRRQITNVIDH